MGKGKTGKGGGKGKPNPGTGSKGPCAGTPFGNKMQMFMQFLGATKGGGKATQKGGNTKGAKPNTIATGGRHRCGKPGHVANDCRSSVELRTCGKSHKVGHLAKDCRTNAAEIEEPDAEADAVEFGGCIGAAEGAAVDTQSGSWEILASEDKPTWRKDTE